MFELLNPSKSPIVSNSFIYFTIIRRAILFSLELIPSSPPHPPPPPPHPPHLSHPPPPSPPLDVHISDVAAL